MKVGTWIPCYRSWIKGDEVQRLAIHAEEIGYDSLWVQDHLVAPVGGMDDTEVEGLGTWLKIEEYGNKKYNAVEYFGEENWWLDPYIVWGFLAGCTSRVELGSCIIVLPYRDPIVQAKMLGTLDVLSAGRMLFGIGVGHVESEFEALQIPFSERGPRTDEYIKVVRQLLQGEEFSFEGEFTKLPRVRPLVKSPQQPSPPIYVGGNSKRAIRRTIELGDFWLPAKVEPDQLQIGLDYMAERAAEMQKPVPGTAVTLVWGIDDPAAPPRGKSSLRKFISLSQASELLIEYAEMGVQHLAIDLPNPNERVLMRQMDLLNEATESAGVRK